ncbi:MAG: addiction module toxin RelE [Flavobacteriales bacterium]|nr:addiction module toxin RelE [Flavobacteriales bacterium]
MGRGQVAYSLTITSLAELDLQDAFSWYENKKSGLGSRFIRKIDEAFQRIQDNPKTFQFRYNNLRVCFLKIFPFGIHFIIVKRQIIVLRVLHTSMNPKKWPD